MRNIEGRMRSSADTQPPEMWARAVRGPAAIAVCAEFSNPDILHGDNVMTPERIEAIRRAGESRGESAERLMRLVGAAQNSDVPNSQ